MAMFGVVNKTSISDEINKKIEQQNIQNSNNKTAKKQYYKIDEIYTYLSYLSQFGKCYQLLNYNQSDNEVLMLFSKIENNIKTLNDKYNLNLFSDYNDWFLNYLRNHYSYNILTYQNLQSHQESIEDVYLKLDKIISSSIEFKKLNNQNLKKSNHPLGKNALNQNFNISVYKEIEMFNIINKLDYIRSEKCKNTLKEHAIGIHTINMIVDLFHTEISLKLVDMIFEQTKKHFLLDDKYLELLDYAKQYPEDSNYNFNYSDSKINNVKMMLYKTYLGLIKNKIFQEYENAIEKTILHYQSLNEDGKILFKEKYSTGIPLHKFEINLDEYIVKIKKLLAKHS